MLELLLNVAGIVVWVKKPLGLENKSADPSLVLNSKMKQDPKVNSLSFFFFN